MEFLLPALSPFSDNMGIIWGFFIMRKSLVNAEILVLGVCQNLSSLLSNFSSRRLSEFLLLKMEFLLSALIQLLANSSLANTQ